MGMIRVVFVRACRSCLRLLCLLDLVVGRISLVKRMWRGGVGWKIWVVMRWIWGEEKHGERY